MKIINSRRGIASLPVVLLIGGIIIEVGITGVLLFYYLNTSLADSRLSNDALAAAQAGAEDAILKIALNKDCPNIACDANYNLTIDDRVANITICKDSCAGSGKTQITSIGHARNKEHTLVAILTVNSYTGELSIDSIKESSQ